jgi:hypothetical protein
MLNLRQHLRSPEQSPLFQPPPEPRNPIIRQLSDEDLKLVIRVYSG